MVLHLSDQKAVVQGTQDAGKKLENAALKF